MLVEDYTRRRISYPSDRLVACAGIAELFGDGIRANYLAGLWSDSLLFDLLWYAGDESNGQGGDSAAPSWSWAASGYGVNYSDGDKKRMRHDESSNAPPAVEQLAEVVEYEVVLEHPLLHFGRVESGFVTLRAPLLGPYKKRVGPMYTQYPYTDHQIVLEPMAHLRQNNESQDNSDRADDKTLFRCPDCKNAPYLPYLDRACSAEEEIEDVWVVPLIYRPSGYVECLLVVAAGEDTSMDGDPLGQLERVHRRVGYWNAWVRVRADSDDETDGFMDKLRQEVDGRWTFPRTEITLV